MTAFAGPAIADAPTKAQSKRNTTGFLVWMNLRVGVLAASGQNGHIYLEICADDGAGNPTGQWAVIDYVANRNDEPAGVEPVASTPTAAHTGVGRGLAGFIPNGFWYRLRSLTPSGGWGLATYITDGANFASFQTVG